MLDKWWNSFNDRLWQLLALYDYIEETILVWKLNIETLQPFTARLQSMKSFINMNVIQMNMASVTC